MEGLSISSQTRLEGEQNIGMTLSARSYAQRTAIDGFTTAPSRPRVQQGGGEGTRPVILSERKNVNAWIAHAPSPAPSPPGWRRGEWGYDTMDRLATRKDALNRTETYQYDPAGNLTQFLDRKNQTSTFTYDALNRRTGASYAGGSSTSFTYDSVGR